MFHFLDYDEEDESSASPNPKNDTSIFNKSASNVGECIKKF